MRSHVMSATLVAFIACAGALQAAEHYIYVVLGTCDTFGCSDPEAAAAWDSGAWVESRLLGIPYVVGMRNDHSVYRDRSVVVGWSGRREGFWSDWHSYLLGGGDAGHCYTAHLTSTAGTSVKDVPSVPFQVCWYGPPTPRCKNPSADGSCPPTGTVCDADTPPDQCGVSPLIINMGRGGYRLSDAEDPVAFDMDANGHREMITWTARGESMSFLALDRNADGVIDSGRELFGNHTPLDSGEIAANGFDALSIFDINHDDRIDALDSVWESLLLWTDVNHNGISEREELQQLNRSEITELGVRSTATWRHDRAGNVYRYQSHLRRGRATDTYYDIYFVRLP